MSNKIALVGSHGVGKTTLAATLRTQLQSTGVSSMITPEVPRTICEIANDSTFFRRGKNSVPKQLLIIAGQIVAEQETSNLAERLVICDRSCLDHWAYTLELFKDEVQGSDARTGNLFGKT